MAAPLNVSKTATLTGGTSVHRQPSGSVEDVVKASSTTPEAAALTGAGSLAWTGGGIRGVLTVSITGVSITGAGNHNVSRTTGDNLACVLNLASPVSVGAGTSEDDPNTLSIENGCTVNLKGASTWRAHDHV